MHILTPRVAEWQPPVVTYSALTDHGIKEIWDNIVAHRKKLTATGAFAARRREQQVKWMWAMFDERLRTRLASDPKLKAKLPQIERAVAEGRLSPALAVDEIVETLDV